jgi:hypothetical protein
MKNISRLVLIYLAAVTCTLGGACALADSRAKAQAAPSATHTIFVREDGSFFPPVKSIQEGDSIVFTGPVAESFVPGLGTTFSVVRTKLSDINANVPCMTTTKRYDIDHDDAELDNELTGPLHRGSSGIFALGPEDGSGFFEGPSSDACEDIGAAAGTPPALSSEEWAEVLGGFATKLCRKVDNRSHKATSTNSPYILQSTWDDPDIAGAVIRINWRSLYTSTLSADGTTETIVPNYTLLDAELDNASRRGKQIFLMVPAGAGIPPWIFDDYVPSCSGDGCTPASTIVATETGIAPKSVVPITTSDFGGGNTGMPTNQSCGYTKKMGSPADAAYTSAMLTMIGKVAEHVRASTLRYQALGSFEITGLNFLTGETRLPNRCLDPTMLNPDTGASQASCFCNTRIWAEQLGVIVPAYEAVATDPPAPLVNGGGYTAAAAKNFLNTVQNKIFVELGRRKTMHYMLIQDGMPKVLDATHYATDAAVVAPNVGYVDAYGTPIYFAQQTVDILANGRLGAFHAINPDGSPVSTEPDGAGALFSPMHAGLQTIPVDPATGLNNCPQAQSMTLVNGKDEADLREPFTYSAILSNANYGAATSGCPNKWAVREGYEGQILGFQTTNEVGTPDELSSALWNGTLNSNMVFLEAYEHALWQARQQKLLGNTALSTTAAGYADVPSRQKSLAEWSAELHKRRRTIASYTSSTKNVHMRDPYPSPYTFTFRKDLAPGEVQSIYFVNPAARCHSGTNYYGTINVTGTNVQPQL